MRSILALHNSLCDPQVIVLSMSAKCTFIKKNTRDIKFDYLSFKKIIHLDYYESQSCFFLTYYYLIWLGIERGWYNFISSFFVFFSCNDVICILNSFVIFYDTHWQERTNLRALINSESK